ncbi:MAG TPA: EI24 domain-containing protein [Burkholderiales bacterium]|nr:EI24 domain-containing protein [Burkholderiales bacterium]
MTDIFVAFARGFGSLFHPRMLWLMIWPMVVSVVLWAAALWLFSGQIIQWLQEYFNISPLATWTSQWFSFAAVSGALAWLLLLLLFVPLVLVTASLIIGIFGMSTMANHVAEREYPTLVRKHGGSIGAMAVNAFYALFIFLVLSIVSLPLWFIPFLWPVLPVLLFAYFNQRMFRFDALAEHASKEEMRTIFSRYSGRMFILAIMLSLVAHIPILGFFTPVLAGLAYIHFGLARLAELRSA